jgi:DNA-binding response OmpR family regulator
VKRTSILAVDGEPGILKLLKAELESRGYIVLCASDGLEALQIFASQEPDIVILDILLGKLDGFEVCRRLRKLSRVPIIILSARSDAADMARAIECGADDYITKPFSKVLLEARIKAALHRS